MKIKHHPLPLIGALGALACIIVFIREPSFPTPDKLVIFLTFVFMIFNQAKEMLRRLLPFVLVILAYESFRGLADNLNTHVNYLFPAHFDSFIFGDLPTVYLQNLLWHGQVSWYDIVLYIPYMLFFVLPFALAILVWKTRAKYYWQVVNAYVVLFFAGFLTFLLLPAAPPWMASDGHYIQHIERISSYVWAALGVHDFPSVYNHIAPNPVAAVPSLHSACSTLFAIFIFKLYGWRWGLVSTVYPLLIFFGVIYEGEHYALDVILGITYAFAAYFIAPSLSRFVSLKLSSLKNALYKRAPVIPKALKN